MSTLFARQSARMETPLEPVPQVSLRSRSRREHLAKIWTLGTVSTVGLVSFGAAEFLAGHFFKNPETIGVFQETIGICMNIASVGLNLVPYYIVNSRHIRFTKKLSAKFIGGALIAFGAALTAVSAEVDISLAELLRDQTSLHAGRDICTSMIELGILNMVGGGVHLFENVALKAMRRR